MISFLPFSGLGAGTGFSIVGEPAAAPGQELVTDVSVCDDGYFETMRVPLLRGRLFTEREMQEKSNVVIVNEALGAALLPPRRCDRQEPRHRDDRPQRPDRDHRHRGELEGLRSPHGDAQPATYWPHPQLAYTAMTLTIRTAADPLSFAFARRARNPRARQGPADLRRANDGSVARTERSRRRDSARCC